MPSDPIAPLIVANDIEKERSFEDLTTPEAFANWFQKLFAVDLATLKKEFNFVQSPTEPKGGDRGKVHFKTSRPIAIGLFVNGSYEYIYKYPPNVPLQFPSTSVPSEITQLTSEERTIYDLSNGDNFVWGWLKV